MDPQLIILPLFFVAMYFVLIRPQRKRQKDVESLQSSLGPGDAVVTIGGLHGEVSEVGDKYVDLFVDAEGTVMRFRRSAIAEVIGDEIEDDVDAGDAG